MRFYRFETAVILCKILDKMALKHPLVKFVKIEARKCIENISDVDIPSMLIYKGGNIHKKFMPAGEVFGGLKMNFNSKYHIVLIFPEFSFDPWRLIRK